MNEGTHSGAKSFLQKNIAQFGSIILIAILGSLGMYLCNAFGLQGVVVAQCMHLETEDRYLAVYRVWNDGLSRLTEPVELKITVFERRDPTNESFPSGLTVSVKGMGELEPVNEKVGQSTSTQYTVTPKTGGENCMLEPYASFGLVLKTSTKLTGPAPDVRCHHKGAEVLIAPPEAVSIRPIDLKVAKIVYAVCTMMTGGAVGAFLLLVFWGATDKETLIKASSDAASEKILSKISPLLGPMCTRVDTLCSNLEELIADKNSEGVKTETQLTGFTPNDVSAQRPLASEALKDKKDAKSTTAKAAAKKTAAKTPKGSANT